MLPGDLLCKFMKERLEENLEFFKDLVKRDLDRQPEKVNLQVLLTPNALRLLLPSNAGQRMLVDGIS